MTRPRTPRVRFAPSPTGYLHIGGARTILFNWLHARQSGGTFVLRIEDTDQARSTDESAKDIIDAMRWLGLDWDEGPEVGGPYGPYSQMERLSTYKEYADRLVAQGKAYRCYATRQQLDEWRNRLPADQRHRFVYPRLWRDKTESDWLAGKPYVVRFKTPLSGQTIFHDKVYGDIVTSNSEIQDFVIMRSDGIPLYNFGAVVDDALMDITLVARGADHILNTAQQVLLYEALSLPIPELAHLPMILGPDGRKLGKRDGERYGIPVSVMQYKDLGYSPEALLNYLVRFGWSYGDQETFMRSELVEYFNIEDVSSAHGKFDLKKCKAICQKVLTDDRYTPFADYLRQLRPFLIGRGLRNWDDSLLEKATRLIRPRSATFVECAEGIDCFLRDEPVFDAQARAKFLTPAAAVHLRALSDALGAVDLFEHEHIEETMQSFLRSRNMEIKDIAPAVRVALTGRGTAPGVIEILAVLGKNVGRRRLEAAARLAEEAQ
ncbi:glutamate--tRNA ligase [Paraburkholderia domus]|uniref:glutamate--tRNA ligase n=1 Tax=Paraburkholderia domus TaxID=2793075 RepID=UPI001B03C22D|nr:glutamate--tRNA ligase [Paraburkholderia domus]CAE6851479.1 Glutamate--tRNA ligase [Paraburkholderia domus]